jgi:hypothetical protein
MDNKPGKRKSRLNNIRGRLNSGAYDMAKFKANEKNLREKVAFFEKKEAANEFKDYMIPRYDEAKELYARLLAAKSGNPTATVAGMAAPIADTAASLQTLFSPGGGTVFANTLSSAPPPAKVARSRTARKQALIPYNEAEAAALAATAPVTSVAPLTLKKLNKKRREAAEAKTLAEGTYAAPAFNPPQNTLATVGQPYGAYGSNGTFVTQGTLAPVYNLGTEGGTNYGRSFNNLATYQTAVPAVATVRVSPKQTRRRKTPTPVFNEYYEQAALEALPLPELYNPYTGVKFLPTEDPLPPIENAYFELKDLLKATHKKAATLRKKSKQASKRKSKKVKFTNTANTLVPSHLLAGASTYVPPQLIGANQRYVNKYHPNNFQRFLV